MAKTLILYWIEDKKRSVSGWSIGDSMVEDKGVLGFRRGPIRKAIYDIIDKRGTSSSASVSNPGGRKWFVYDATNSLVLSGYKTKKEATEEAHKVNAEFQADPDTKGIVIAVLPRGHQLIKRYAKTHPAWAQREGFSEEIRKGDVGVLTKIITAEDTAGVKHNIPSGIEVKVAEIRVAYISFYTDKAIDGQTYFTAPTFEFNLAFKKR